MKEIDNFERRNIKQSKKAGYPKIALDEAMNFNKRFAEHLASKKKKDLYDEMQAAKKVKNKKK
jgi:hypothetical protein